jgi:hypothetical protein
MSFTKRLIIGDLQELPRRSKSVPGRSSYRPRLEALEDRLAPATNITVIPTGIGNLDHFLSASAGTITAADDPGDTAATLSATALHGVGPEVPISITAAKSIVFRDLGTLNLETDIGLAASFVASTGAILFNNVANTVATSGGSLTFNAGTSLTVCNLNTNGGDVSLAAGLSGAGNIMFPSIRTGGSGNLSFQATNAAGGSITQTGGTSVASGLAIGATATGNILVGSLRGTTVDLSSNGGAVGSEFLRFVQASAQLSVSAAKGIVLNALATSLSASNSTSGNITIVQAALQRQALNVASSAGGVVNSAPGGQIRLTNFGSGITVEDGASVQSRNGPITLSALDFSLAGVVNSGSAATTLANSTAGRQIDLGTNTPGKIGLTRAELDNITAAVLRIGTSSAGDITISAPITSPFTWNVLSLFTGSFITEVAPFGSLTVPNLRVSSAGLALLGGANDITVLAANTPASGISFDNGTHFLTVGVVDGQTGLTASFASLTADDLNIAQNITTGSNTSGTVELEPFTSGRSIDLGTNSFGNLGLDNTELNRITAGVLRIGSSFFKGNIIVTAAINPLSIGALSLQTTFSGTISQGSGDTITVASGNGGLAIRSQTAVALTEQNDVAILAAAIGGTNQNFTFTNIKKLLSGTIDGLTGVTASGMVTIND